MYELSYDEPDRVSTCISLLHSVWLGRVVRPIVFYFVSLEEDCASIPLPPSSLSALTYRFVSSFSTLYFYFNSRRVKFRSRWLIMFGSIKLQWVWRGWECKCIVFRPAERIGLEIDGRVVAGKGELHTRYTCVRWGIYASPLLQDTFMNEIFFCFEICVRLHGNKRFHLLMVTCEF